MTEFIYFVITLVAMHTALCVIVVPYTIAYEYHMVTNNGVCIFFEYIRHALVLVSGIFLCAVALHCYYCVQRIQDPDDGSQYREAMVFTLLIGCVLAVPASAIYMAVDHDGLLESEMLFVVALLNTYDYSNYAYTYCRFTATFAGLSWAMVYQGMLFICFLITVILTFILFILMFRKLHTQRQRGVGHTETPYVSSQRSVVLEAQHVHNTCIMLGVGAMFSILCWLPVWVDIFASFNVLIFRYSFLLPPAILPIIYVIFNKQLRHLIVEYVPIFKICSYDDAQSTMAMSEEERARLEEERRRRLGEEAERRRREKQEAEENRRKREKEEEERMRQREELEKRPREELEKKQREELEKKPREELEKRPKEELEKRPREELEKRLRDELEKKQKEKPEKRLRDELEKKQKEKPEKRLRDELEKKQREELEKKQREELEKKQRKELEKKQRKELEKKQRKELEKRLREELEKKQRKELEKKQRKELEKRLREELEKKLREKPEKKPREEL
nr:hypothetical protein BaRGS_030674 [Batillaria attramentaria]